MKVAKLKECMVSHAFSPDICFCLVALHIIIQLILFQQISSNFCSLFGTEISNTFQKASIRQHFVKDPSTLPFQPRCVAEDTHVFRYALQLGWAPSEKQRASHNKARLQLISLSPGQIWSKLGTTMIQFDRCKGL